MLRRTAALVLTMLAARGAAAQVDTTRVNHSAIAFTVNEKDLLPENVAHDPRDRSFYVGSTRKGKIVRVDSSRRVSDFVPAGSDGVWMIVGMKIDPARRLLWANTSAASNFVGLEKKDEGRAALLAYDLRTGRRVARIELADGRPHFFNDLVVLANGDVVLTDMAGGALYRLRQGARALETIAAPGSLTDPNGIAAAPDEASFYVAHRGAIVRVRASDGSVSPLAHPDSVAVGGIDGLYVHDGSLIAVQSGRRRVVRFPLDAGGDRVNGIEVLEANHPIFMNPTTGVVVGDDFYYIANSQFDSFDADGRLFPLERLYEVVVLRVPLRAR
jgi:sugar lactone lactonase YvrE